MSTPVSTAAVSTAASFVFRRLPRPTAARIAGVVALLAAPCGMVNAQYAFDRDKPPALGTAARLVVPTVRATTLPNGIQLSVVEQRELPLVQIVASFAGGSRLDGDRPGSAAFTASMLDEGAGTRDATALQSELAYLGAALGTNADWDRITVSLKVPLRSLGPALDLMADVIRRPTFAAAEVRRQRDLRLTTILQQKDQPNALADLAFNQIVFPAGHPYHANPFGDSATTSGVDSASLRTFYARALRPELTRIVVVGDIAEPQARAELVKRFGDWRGTGAAAAPAAVTTAPTRQQASRLYLVDKPNAAQSVITIGWPGVERRSPDYAALMVMNTLLGGSFTSRLNMKLREEKGYTYGAGSRFAFRRVPGAFSASASVRTNVTDSSLVEFFHELRRVRDSLVPQEELDRAKAYVELGLPGSLESTTQVASTIAQLATFDLPLTELTEFATRVRAVTAADIQRVAKQYLTPDQATIVVVGDLSAIRPSIEALKLGELTVLDVKNVVR